MLQVVETTSMPNDLELLPFSAAELAETPKFGQDLLVKHSSHTWVLMDETGVLMVVGIFAPDLIGRTPELWMLVTEHFRTNLRRNLRAIAGKIEVLLELYPRVKVQVENGHIAGHRFALFFGFEPKGSITHPNGRTYVVYEVLK